VYISKLVFSKTTRTLQFNGNVISITYEIVLTIYAQLIKAIVSQYIEDWVVCPPVLKQHLVSVPALENIKHNPSATTVQISLHGRSSSMVQTPSLEYDSEKREQLNVNSDPSQKGEKFQTCQRHKPLCT